MKPTYVSLVWLIVAAACGQDQLQRANDNVTVVGGTPSVSGGLPGVDRLDAGVDGGPIFGQAAPYQVDSFQQQTIQKVDILWIISNSGAMQAKQDQLKANFVSFMQFLVAQQIDFHLGVITTDVYDPQQSGRLINAAGLSAPWIDSSTPNPIVAFAANASVGTAGSHDVMPFLAGMLALTPPLTPTTPASPDAGAANCANGTNGPECFLRPDAALYVVILSDHEDNSCGPIAVSTEGCDDATAALSGYGDIDYWTRFYSGLKGADGSVKVAAIASTQDDTFQCDTTFAHLCDQNNVSTVCSAASPNCNVGSGSDPCCLALHACYNELNLVAPYCRFANLVDPTASHAVPPYYQISSYIEGCLTYAADGGVDASAWTAPRITQVALNTAGVATSICEENYTPALADIGLQAAGLRTAFPLSRAPIDGSLTVTVDGTAVLPSSTTWQWIRCSGPSPANEVDFTSPPAPGAEIAVGYSVDVGGLGSCP